jgi:hypothetical protein
MLHERSTEIVPRRQGIGERRPVRRARKCLERLGLLASVVDVSAGQPNLRQPVVPANLA